MAEEKHEAGMSTGGRPSWRMIAAAGVAGGLSGLVPVGHLTGWKRAAFSVAEAPLFAVVAAGQKDAGVPQRAALAGLVTAAAALGKNASVVLDRRAETWLVGRGVSHPRLVIAAVSGVVGAVWMAVSKPAPSSAR